MPPIARIALNRPIRRLFDYNVAEDLTLVPGQRVHIPFGRQTATGLVVETGVEPPQGISIKSVFHALEPWPALPNETLRLLNWASNYYQHPLGECLFTALPPALRRGRPAQEKAEQWWRTCGDASTLPANAYRQTALLTWMKAHPQGVRASDTVKAGFTRSQINSLHNKGLVEPVTSPVTTQQNVNGGESVPPPRLSAAQQKAAQQLPPCTDKFNASLLYGVTGSGKTEIYLHYLKKNLKSGDQALVLVPEINLTPQTVARFRRYFGDRIVMWHSALNDSERLNTWLRIRRGEPVILVGTRSAVLLPFTGLRTVVVDEEHDSSYKQGEGFRYSGRDLAVFRAHLNNCPVILGSATPSLESIYNAQSGKYQLIRLDERARIRAPPTIHMLDIRSRPLEGGLSRPAINAIRQTIERGEQALVFVNRRGFAPIMMCFDCGHIVECPRCDSRLTYHRRDRAMRCHHCDYQAAATSHCPSCQSEAFKPVGQGTERAEDTLTAIFPDIPVVRVDRDSTQRKGSIQAILRQINSGTPCIMVGTQMLAKGHDFPNVTLVVVVNADGGLFSVDFRAPEQLIQTLLQVSGRAGRGEKSGRVLVQTCHSDFPLLRALCEDDYLQIAEQLIAERKTGNFPPFRHLAILRAEAQSMTSSLELLDRYKPSEAYQGVEIWGPLPSIIARRADRYRAQLLIFSNQRGHLNAVLSRMSQELDREQHAASTKWHIDVDPLETG